MYQDLKFDLASETERDSIKEELFRKAVQSARKYVLAVEKDIPAFENYYHSLHEEQIAEIKSNGWYDEYEEFSVAEPMGEPSEQEEVAKIGA